MVHERLSLFWEFFKIGTFTLGGGLAMVPQIQDTVVNRKKWLDSTEMLDCIAIAQSLPGIVAINTATYVGYRKHGVSGAAAATAGVALPAVLAIIIAVALLGQIGDNKYIEGAFTGVKAAVVGLIFVTAVSLFKQNTKGKSKKNIVFDVILCLAAFAAVILANISVVIVIAMAIVIGNIYAWRNGDDKQ